MMPDNGPANTVELRDLNRDAYQPFQLTVTNGSAGDAPARLFSALASVAAEREVMSVHGPDYDDESDTLTLSLTLSGECECPTCTSARAGFTDPVRRRPACERGMIRP